MKIQKLVLLYLCLLLPYASAVCSEVEVVTRYRESPTVPVKNPVDLSYVHLGPTSEGELSFVVLEDDVGVGRFFLHERDGVLSKVTLTFPSDGDSWSSSDLAAGFRLERPQTRLRLDYSSRHLNVSLYDEGQTRWRHFYSDAVPTDGSGSLGIIAVPVMSEYLVQLPCRSCPAAGK